MEYKIVEKSEFKVIGINRKMSTKNKEDWTSIPKFWGEFRNEGIEKNLKRYAIDDNVFAVTTYTDEADCYWYMLCVGYNGDENKEDYEVMNIPGGTYAIFEVPSEYGDNIGEFTMRIFNEWLPSTGYKLTGKAEIECETKNGTVIWMPIKK